MDGFGRALARFWQLLGNFWQDLAGSGKPFAVRMLIAFCDIFGHVFCAKLLRPGFREKG